MTTHPLIEYFRCPEHLAVLRSGGGLAEHPGYFAFGGAICYGRQSRGAPAAPRPDVHLPDVLGTVSSADGKVLLPFDLPEVLTNLRWERYRTEPASMVARILRSSLAHSAYYAMRPILGVGVRKHLQKLRLTGWRQIAFPRWPVDVTIETLMKQAVRVVLERGGEPEFPFIWFWPDGAPACAMVTHDVEGPAGADRVSALMDLDEGFGIPSAFDLVPHAKASPRLLEQCRRRGFEVNVHDLNHDGHLFSSKELFDRRVVEINKYVREWGCRGFRSGAMNRRQEWFAELDVSFDMSVPSMAHLEPQQGGCCTVMPHFIGDLLELPLTMLQDYSLFHVLDDYSTERWKEQFELILTENGLASLIVHPDYQRGARERDVYLGLLRQLAQLRDEHRVWIASPSEIDRWWRQRQAMTLVRAGDGWCIEGPGAERAVVAHARLHGDTVRYHVNSRALAA